MLGMGLLDWVSTYWVVTSLLITIFAFFFSLKVKETEEMGPNGGSMLMAPSSPLSSSGSGAGGGGHRDIESGRGHLDGGPSTVTDEEGNLVVIEDEHDELEDERYMHTLTDITLKQISLPSLATFVTCVLLEMHIYIYMCTHTFYDFLVSS